MQHDSMPLNLSPPKTSHPSSIRKAYLNFLESALNLAAKSIAQDPNYHSNENGHLAWDVSLYIRAALKAWDATANELYLRYAVYWAADLCERTDDSLGIQDWRARSTGAWSAGARYTAGTATVGTLNGLPIQLQAAADAVVVERPTQTTARIQALRGEEVVWSPPEGTLSPSGDSYLPDVLALNGSVHSLLFTNIEERVDLGSIEPGVYPLRTRNAPHLVHTGLIIRSLLDVAERLEEIGVGTISSALTPRELYSTARSALSVHDEDLVDLDGQPWYITPDDFPGRRLGMELPHNHIVDAATSSMILGAKMCDEELLRRGRLLAGRTLSEIAHYNGGDSRHLWTYYPRDSDNFKGEKRANSPRESAVRAASRAEDSSHATMRIRAFNDWKSCGLLDIPDGISRTFCRSARDSFIVSVGGQPTVRWLPYDQPGSAKEGSVNSYVGSFGLLGKVDRTMIRIVNKIASRNFPTIAFGATVLSASEIVEMNSRQRVESAPAACRS